MAKCTGVTSLALHYVWVMLLSTECRDEDEFDDNETTMCVFMEIRQAYILNARLL